MALQCQVSLNVSSMSAGMTPPPQATITVYNPNAVAVVVTGAALRVIENTGLPMPAIGAAISYVGAPPSLMPIGPGQTVLVPALGSITIGPFPVAVNSAANANQFQMVNQTGNNNPLNPQGSSIPIATLLVGATVQGSDGSTNEAQQAGLIVSYQSQPPLGSAGGFLQFSVPMNFMTGLLTGTV
jgi:hypothetical protein